MRSERLTVEGEGADCRSLAAHFRCEHEYKINKLGWLLARYHFGVVINCVRFESDSLASSYRPYLSRKVEASFRRSLTVNPEKLVLVDLDGMVAGEYLSMYSPAAAGSEVLHFVVVQVSGITQRLSGDKKFSDGFFCYNFFRITTRRYFLRAMLKRGLLFFYLLPLFLVCAFVCTLIFL